MEDEEHDFGFSFTTEEEMTVVQENLEKAEKLRQMIMPLLMNLKKNPEKDLRTARSTIRQCYQTARSIIQKI